MKPSSNANANAKRTLFFFHIFVLPVIWFFGFVNLFNLLLLNERRSEKRGNREGVIRHSALMLLLFD